MKFLPITVLVTLLICGCKQADPLAFIPEYHDYALQCSQAIDQHTASDGSKSIANENCQPFALQAKSFEQQLNALTPNQSAALNQSAPYKTMLSKIMEVGFRYSALNSSTDDKVVVLTSPNVIRVIPPAK